MKHESPSQPSEPVGIVISSGINVRKAPKFSAYVWGSAPDVEVEIEVQAA